MQFFNQISKISLIVLACFYLSGCYLIGQKVEVPPAHLGKVLTKSGYKPNSVTPSKFRLDSCLAYCDRLVILEVSDQGRKESFTLFMPKDQLNMTFDVRMTISVDNTKIDNIFDRIPPKQGKIPFAPLYTTYAQPVVRDIVRQVVANYSINEVASSRERVSQELFDKVSEALKPTPLYVKRFGLADVQFPEVITRAKEAAAERREQISREKAQFEIQKIQLERQLEEAKMTRAIEREKAQATKEVNDILAKSVTDKFLAYRSLEVLEQMASSNNKVFVPVEALGTVGLQQAVFSDQVRSTAKKR